MRYRIEVLYLSNNNTHVRVREKTSVGFHFHSFFLSFMF